MFNYHDYTIAWISALPKELAAAQQMLDEEHPSLPQQQGDQNVYSLGRIGNHNIVLVCLPAGQMGTNSAAVVVTRLIATFSSLRYGLMVGIGGAGGSPEKSNIRLGDIVVGQPFGSHSGVVQWDFGKATPGKFERTGSLNAPPPILLQAVAHLRAQRGGKRSLLPYISKMEAPYSVIPEGADVLYKATYAHVGSDTCKDCSESEIIPRPERPNKEIVFHYGTIASGNQVIKDGVLRDDISAQAGGILCFEMEAAGFLNILPCLVIRGICDYADSHKNKSWQEYAAGTAAAYAKKLLSIVPGEMVGTNPRGQWNSLVDSSDAATKAPPDRVVDDGASNDAEQLMILNIVKKVAQETALDSSQAATEPDAIGDDVHMIVNTSHVPFRNCIASTAWPTWNNRVYFQDSSAKIQEVGHSDKGWAKTPGHIGILDARPQTQLAAISRYGGEQIHIFYIGNGNVIREACYNETLGWHGGPLNEYNLAVASFSRLAATSWAKGIHLYYQTSNGTLTEYRWSDGDQKWAKGDQIGDALRGSSLAAATFAESTDLRTHIFYQDEDMQLREKVWHGSWAAGTLPAIKAAPYTPLAGVSWRHSMNHLRLFWRSDSGRLTEMAGARWSRQAIEIKSSVPFSEEFGLAAIQWRNGRQERVFFAGGDLGIFEEKSTNLKWRAGDKIQF